MTHERKAMLENITIIKEKLKTGIIDKVVDNNTLHIKELFNKETAPDIFMNLKVTLALTGHKGTIFGTFGKSGKLKVRLEGDGLGSVTDEEILANLVGSNVELRYKKNMMKHKANKFK